MDPVSVVDLSNIREQSDSDRSAFLERRTAKYLRNSRIPAWMLEMRNVDLEVDPQVYDVCTAFVESIASGTNVGKGILFYGRPGRGKTTLAITTLFEILSTVPPERFPRTDGQFTTTPALYLTYVDLIQNEKDCWSSNEEKATAAQNLSDRLHCRSLRATDNIKVLALDDVGKEHSGKTGFTSNSLHRLLRARYDAACPTLVTTNLDPGEDWDDLYGEATASFIHQAFDIVRVGGQDRRRK